VDGHGDADGFMSDSAHAAHMIRDTLAGAGVRLEELGSVLDFGCGCGRVARNWAGLSGPELHGCDYNPQLVEWCRDNLPFMRVRVNAPAPPSPYDDDSFDLVYAISILTHLTEPQALAWMADLRRILKPGGLLLLTLHGDAFTKRLGADERERYERGEVVVQRSGTAGMNVCAAYHPASYVTGTLLAGLELAAHRTGRRGSFPQDAWLARRPAS
jgi:ubiquinone/menaquinone biosynthesis C-methylase UbiE